MQGLIFRFAKCVGREKAIAAFSAEFRGEWLRRPDGRDVIRAGRDGWDGREGQDKHHKHDEREIIIAPASLRRPEGGEARDISMQQLGVLADGEEARKLQSRSAAHAH